MYLGNQEIVVNILCTSSVMSKEPHSVVIAASPLKEWYGQFSCVKTLTSLPSILSSCHLMRDHPYSAEMVSVDTAPG